MSSGFCLKSLAATYSRGIYKTTTIGKAAFDGRVRNGNGSGHSFMTTKVSGRRPWLLQWRCDLNRNLVRHFKFVQRSCEAKQPSR
jgi:hypothetical protein